MFTLSPDLQYTSTIRVLIGELIISSNAGATLPVALIVLFIVPRSAVDTFTSFMSMLGSTSRLNTYIIIKNESTPAPTFIHIARFLRIISSLGICLSITK